MKENIIANDQAIEFLYRLQVRAPDLPTQEIDVHHQVLAGLDPRNDLIIIDPKILPKHFIFKRRNNILTIHYLGNTGDSFLNGQTLENKKSYILEKTDIIEVGKIEIIVLREIGTNPLPNTEIQTVPLGQKTIENLPDIQPLNFEPPSPQDQEQIKKESFFNFSTVKLIPYKIYGFGVDFAITYLILIFVIPYADLLVPTQHFLYPISEYLLSFMASLPDIDPNLKIISVIDFFICFHLFMIIFNLILGMSPGAFLIGLHPNTHRNIISSRFKAYLYSLFNIVLLPLIIFDLPCYYGRTLKEILTFTRFSINNSIFYKILRRAVVPGIMAICFLSPLFLKAPYTSNIIIEKNKPSKYKEVKSSTIVSASKEMGISLNTDLDHNFSLLPVLDNNKIGLIYYDLVNNMYLSLEENNRLSYKEALYLLRYANPLASRYLPNETIPPMELKPKILSNLTLSMVSLIPNLFEYGPFFFNGLLLKKHFLKNFSDNDNFMINTFEPKTPVFKISSNGNDDQIFLFLNQEMVSFNIRISKGSAIKAKMVDSFTHHILNGLHFLIPTKGQGDLLPLPNPQILEALDALILKDHETLLTYYTNEAMKIRELDNPKWRIFLQKNIEKTKKILMQEKIKAPMKKEIERSFDDIITSINNENKL